MKIVSVVGARPQFIKLAPLMAPMAQRVDSIVIHTGQHYDAAMSHQFFSELGMPEPDYRLEVGSGSHGAQTGKMLAGIEEVLLAEKPDMVLVIGDTNSTLAGALAASKLHIPIAHVESGLRSYNRIMPEEINRLVTDHVSTLLFAPTQTACQNLAREGITRGVHLVGDITVDAIQRTLSLETTVEVPPEPFLLLTLHRAENTDRAAQMLEVLSALHEQKERVLFPCHPRTFTLLREHGWLDRFEQGPIQLMDPIGHRDTLELVRHARLVLTDSGGLQKEAYLLNTPCLTLRDETEWVETITVGWNQLVGMDSEKLVQAIRRFSVPTEHPPIFGSGQTAATILDVMCQSLIGSAEGREASLPGVRPR